MSKLASPAEVSLGGELPESPLSLLGRWLREAESFGHQPNPSAFCLATADADGRPSARMVLCRDLDESSGSLVFYTNRESQKGVELSERSYATGVFHWDHLARQARISGPVGHCSSAESDEYWGQRERDSQLAAWASDQSRPVASRDAFLERLAAAESRFAGEPVPRPPHWGGYRLHIEQVELWLGAAGRAHDRGLWTRTLTRRGDAWDAGPWQATRLQP